MTGQDLLVVSLGALPLVASILVVGGGVILWRRFGAYFGALLIACGAVAATFAAGWFWFVEKLHEGEEIECSGLYWSSVDSSRT